MLLGDPVLDALVECSVDGNLTSYAALTRVWQARTQVCIAESAKKGMVNGTASQTRTLQSQNGFGNFAGLLGGAGGGGMGGGMGGGGGGFGPLGEAFNNSSIGAQTSWEPDIWGRVYRQVEAAEATVCGNVEAYRDTLVMLYGDIASTYVQIRTLQSRLEYAKKNVQIQQRARDLVQRRVEGGISPVLEEHQADSNVASTEAEIPQLEAQLHQALNRLAVLAGEYPGTLHDCLAQPFPIPDPPAQLPLVLPCNVIRQRPDIRQAERNLAARTAEVGVAVADLYPRLTLGGTFSLSSNELSSLLEGDSFGYSLGPNITWPILNGGRIRCDIERTKYAVEEALATYQQAVLTGIEEVENAIVSYRTERERRDALRRTVEAAEKSLESVLALYRNDKTDFQNVLDTLRTLFAAQNSLAASEGQMIQNLITLYRSLGGGWDVNAHCEDRCVRLRCPQRVDASVAELEPNDDASERYFDGGSPKLLNRAKSPDDLDLPELPKVDSKEPDVEKGKPFDVDTFFRDILEKTKSGSDAATNGGSDGASTDLKQQSAKPADQSTTSSKSPDLESDTPSIDSTRMDDVPESEASPFLDNPDSAEETPASEGLLEGVMNEPDESATTSRPLRLKPYD